MESSGSPLWEDSPFLHMAAPYTSPELFAGLRGDSAGKAADIYSLGAILYELLHPDCRPPSPGDPVRGQRPRAEVPADLPHAQVVARCLAADPAQRYASVRDLLADLEGDPGGEDADDPIDALWQRALLWGARGGLRRASRYCSDVLQQQPEHRQAREMLERIDERSRQALALYEEAETLAASGDLGQSLRLVAEAAEIFPEHLRGRVAQAKVAARAAEFRKAIEGGIRARTQGYWDLAISRFRTAAEIHTGSAVPEQAIRQVIAARKYLRCQRLRIGRAVENREFGEALRLSLALERYLDWLCPPVEQRQAEEKEHADAR